MKEKLMLVGSLAVVGLIAGCATPPPPGAELGPHGTIAYNVHVESSDPAVRIETNRVYAGTTPLTVKIFGDKDGTFHDFGSYFYVIQAYPNATETNHFVQTKWFRTGHYLTPEDYIPGSVYFDMSQPPSTPSPYHVHGYPGYYYGPGIYFGGPWWGPWFGPPRPGPGPIGPGPGPHGPGPGPGGPGPHGPGPGGPHPH